MKKKYVRLLVCAVLFFGFLQVGLSIAEGLYHTALGYTFFTLVLSYLVAMMEE